VYTDLENFEGTVTRCKKGRVFHQKETGGTGVEMPALGEKGKRRKAREKVMANQKKKQLSSSVKGVVPLVAQQRRGLSIHSRGVQGGGGKRKARHHHQRRGRNPQ